MTVQEQNKMIAEFMGAEIITGNNGKLIARFPDSRGNITGHYVSEVGYDCKWSWLMPVVVKITTMDHGRYGITLDPHGIEIRDYSEETEPLIHRIINDDNYSLMELYYSIVTEFIEWYNLNLATTPQNQPQ